MQLRHIKTRQACHASAFNTSSLNEILVLYDDGDTDSDYLSNYEVLLTRGPRAGQWRPLVDAFKDHDVIRDNYNTRFAEPSTDADRERGYWL